jgi:4-diphosphocytidyl-2-C-methyl-D-erythritol kinase
MSTRLAPAKLNLMLSVGEALPEGHPKRGYHPIASWFAAIDLCDEVEVTRLEAGSSRYGVRWAEDAPRKSMIDWPLEKDLAVRAHRALEARVGVALPVAMTLTKRIPVGGGLGGGSSDAAACLLAVREAFGLDVADDGLREVAMGLGSDVAYFVDDSQEGGGPRMAIVSGLGDVIERVPPGGTGEASAPPIEQPILLVVPPFGCATQAVYKAFDDTLAAELKEYRLDRAVAGATGRERSTAPKDQMVRTRAAKMLERGEIETDLLFNDLARPAFAVEPRLGQLVTALSNATRSPAHVTGSGSCVFLAPPSGKLEWFETRVRRTCEALGATGAFGGEIAVVVTELRGEA